MGVGIGVAVDSTVCAPLHRAEHFKCNFMQATILLSIFLSLQIPYKILKIIAKRLIRNPATEGMVNCECHQFSFHLFSKKLRFANLCNEAIQCFNSL